MHTPEHFRQGIGCQYAQCIDGVAADLIVLVLLTVRQQSWIQAHHQASMCPKALQNLYSNREESNMYNNLHV